MTTILHTRPPRPHDRPRRIILAEKFFASLEFDESRRSDRRKNSNSTNRIKPPLVAKRKISRTQRCPQFIFFLITRSPSNPLSKIKDSLFFFPLSLVLYNFPKNQKHAPKEFPFSFSLPSSNKKARTT